MALNKFATLKNVETGETICEMIGPPNAATSGDVLSESLYALSELVIRGLKPDAAFGGLGGEFGYACEFENEVFQLFPDYQGCACPYSDYDPDSEAHQWFGPPQNHKPDCFFVIDKPNFRHKASGFEVRWYKWIGRDMELSRQITGEEWSHLWQECVDSLPKDAVDRALAESKLDAEREADPEHQQRQQEMFTAIMDAAREASETCERQGHDDPDGHCNRCSLVTDFERWCKAKRG